MSLGKGVEYEIWETSLSSAGGSDGLRCSSLAMVFGYYGSYYSLAHLRELAKTTMDGTTALGLVKVAEEIGFETRAIKADMTLFDLPDLTFPFVAHVLKEGKLLHYYVVIGKDKDSIHIADPDPGVKLTKLPRERFAEEWDRSDSFYGT